LAELIDVDMTAGAHKQQPYLGLNPYGRVPTLQEDDFVLYESTSILDYLEATLPRHLSRPMLKAARSSACI